MAQCRRDSQERIFTKLKSDNQLDYVPTRTWVGNQIYLLSTLLAHNLGRELQMIAHPPSRTTLEKRPALWAFVRLDTLRRRLIQRAGRLIRPQGQLTQSVRKPRCRRRAVALPGGLESCLKSANYENLCNVGGSARLIWHGGVIENVIRGKAGQPPRPRVMA